MLLSVHQQTGQTPSTKNHLVPHIGSTGMERSCTGVRTRRWPDAVLSDWECRGVQGERWTQKLLGRALNRDGDTTEFANGQETESKPKARRQEGAERPQATSPSTRTHVAGVPTKRRRNRLKSQDTWREFSRTNEISDPSPRSSEESSEDK